MHRLQRLQATPPGKALLTGLRLLALLVLAYLPCKILIKHFTPETGLLGNLYLGELKHAEALPEFKALPAIQALERTAYGYDGQFYAQIALRPFSPDDELAAAVDNPAYRYRRIGLPFLAYCLGLGKPAWILQAYAALNYLAWAGLLALLLRRYPPTKQRHLSLIIALLGGSGTLYSLERALTDFPAVALGIAGILLTQRWWLRALLLAASGLIKETSLLTAGAALPGWPWPARHAIRQLVAGAIVVLPVFA